MDYRVSCQNTHAVVSSDKEWDDRQIQQQWKKWSKNSFIIQMSLFLNNLQSVVFACHLIDCSFFYQDGEKQKNKNIVYSFSWVTDSSELH